MNGLLIAAIIVLVALGMFGAGFWVRSRISRSRLGSAELRSKQMLEEAARGAETLRKQAALEAKELQHTVRQEFEE